MAESLLHSWLCYVKNCSLTQTNWKIALDDSALNEFCNEKRLIDLYNQYGEEFYSSLSLKQFIKQSEIDVVGYNFKDKHLYLVDTAFHENGLGYKNNTAKVVFKCFRSLLIGMFLFKDIKNISVLFCTPKMRIDKKRKYDELSKEISSMEEIAKKFKTELEIDEINIQLIWNKEFQDEILKKTLDKSKNVSDVSALFIRALKLNNMFSSIETKTFESETDNKEENETNNSGIKNIFHFFPSIEEFDEEMKVAERYFVATFDIDGRFIKKYEHKSQQKENKSTWRSILASHPKYRKSQRKENGIVNIVAFSNSNYDEDVIEKKLPLLRLQ